MLNSVATAQPKSDANLDPAADLVVRALQAEVANQNEERIKLLQEAVTVSPDYAAARWHLGQIKRGGIWMSAEEIAKTALNDSRVSRYIALRARLGSAEKHYAQSIWLTPSSDKGWCYLRKTFDLPVKPISAELHIWTRSPAVIFINGKRIDVHKPVEHIVDLRVLKDLQTGSNTIALQVKAGPPSVLVWLRGGLEDGSTFSVPGDTTWKATTNEVKNWSAASFDDRNWPSPVEYSWNLPPDNLMAAAHAEERKNALISSMRAMEEELIARWCSEQQLEAQARFHWGHLLLAAPKHIAAMKSLGLTRVGDELLTKEQIDARKELDAAKLVALARWGPTLKAGLRKLNSKTTTIVEEGRKSIEAIVEPDAIPALRSWLNGQQQKTNASFATACIEALRRIDDPVVPEVIVEAVFHHPEHPVALAASKALAKCELTSFVPAIMVRLEAPIQLEFEEVRLLNQMTEWTAWSETERGKMELDEEKGKYREKKETKAVGEILNRVAIYRFRTSLLQPRPFGEFREEKTQILQLKDENKLRFPIADDARIAAENSPSNAVAEKIRSLKREIETRNYNIRWHNQGLAWLLENITKQPALANPEPWWNWWKKYNGLDYMAPMTVRNANWWDRFVNSEEMRQSPDYPRECFANGTPVWTLRGMVPIESILAGDEVLSQDPLTGALAYKLVLGTSTRTPTSLVRVKVGRDVIVGTPRHRIWLSGQGWKTINQIAKGDRLHSVVGSLTVSEIGEIDEAQTSSLEIEEFHSFFVGREKILVHDSGLPERTDRILPSLSAVK